MSMVKAPQPWVYIVPGWSQMPFTPAQALALIPGNMKSNNQEKAAVLFVGMSVENDRWCGVAKPHLIKEVHRICDDERAMFVEEAIEQMIDEGTMEIVENHNSWWSKFSYGQYNHIVCPTFAFLDWLWMRQLRKLPKAVSF